jgi:hypothetical protein
LEEEEGEAASTKETAGSAARDGAVVAGDVALVEVLLTVAQVRSFESEEAL